MHWKLNIGPRWCDFQSSEVGLAKSNRKLIVIKLFSVISLGITFFLLSPINHTEQELPVKKVKGLGI